VFYTQFNSCVCVCVGVVCVCSRVFLFVCAFACECVCVRLSSCVYLAFGAFALVRAALISA
jgi:hypothetical protein